MKNKLFILSLALLGASSVMASVPNSATSTDTAKNYATVMRSVSAPTIDGVADEDIWKTIPENPIDRPFKDETPSLYSAFWKAFWNDTAIFVLVQCEDNSFWPDWKSGYADWQSDKVELYFDANGSLPCPYGAYTGGTKGVYQVTHDYDNIPNMGIPHIGNFAGTYEANTWSYGDHSILTTEWSVNYNTLKDSLGISLDPESRTKIGFDVCVTDLDTVGPLTRQRQMWSNTARGFGGVTNEDWNRMDSVGIIEFLPNFVIDTIPPSVVITSSPTDTVTGDFKITITFSERVTGFTASDLNITNGASKIGTFATTNSIVFTDIITPTSAGDVIIGIDSAVCTDLSSNANLAATPVKVTYAPDLTPPSVLITSNPADTVHGRFAITITFSEKVIGFTASDLTIDNGVSKSGTFATTDSIVYTDEIVPLSAGEVTIGIDANVCTDLHLNANLAATPITVIYQIPTGIENTSTGSVNLYPNPVNGVLHFNLTGCSGDATFSIYNMIGSMIYEKTYSNSDGAIDITSIESGVYILKVNIGKEVITKQLIVK